MKKISKLFCFSSLALLACSATVVTLASTGVFKPASGGNDPSSWTYNHYTTLLPAGGNDGVREYWCSCDDSSHKKLLENPSVSSKNVTIVECGPASLERIKDDPNNNFLLINKSSFDVNNAYKYDATNKIFKNSSGAEPLNQRHYTTHSIKKEGSQGSQIDSSYTTSNIPGVGGYSSYTNPYTHIVTPSLDMGQVNLKKDNIESINALHEYTCLSTSEDNTIYVGIASTAYHISDPSQPVKLNEVLELRFNQYPETSCPTGDIAVLPLGQDTFVGYNVSSFKMPATAQPKYNHVTIKRKYNADIGGKIRIAWYGASQWPKYEGIDTASDRTATALCRLANNESYIDSLDNQYGSDYTKGYANVPLNSNYVNLLIPSGSKELGFNDGVIKKIKKKGDGFSFNLNVGTPEKGNTSLCFFEFEIGQYSDDSSCKDLKSQNGFSYDKYVKGSSPTPITGAFAFQNDAENPKSDIKRPKYELAWITSYFYLPENKATNTCTVSIAMPLSPGKNAITVKQDTGSTNDDFFFIKEIKIFSNATSLAVNKLK